MPAPGAFPRDGTGGCACDARTIVQVVGDGSFHFCNPDSALAVSRRYGLPVLTVVLDNGGWAAVKEATLRMYPDGHAREAEAYASQLCESVDLAMMARSAGAHGERVGEPAALDGALSRAFDAMREGRSTVLQVAIGPH